MTPAPIRHAIPALTALAVAGLLAGCVGGTPASGPSGSPAPTSEPTATPTPTPTPGTARPIDLACSDLVDAAAVAAWDPRFVLLGDWSPDAGTPAADALDAGGVACRWLIAATGDVLDVSVAELPADEIHALKNEAFAASTMVPTYGDEAYFAAEDGVGTAIVFQGEYWLVASSSTFAEPGEPTDIIDSALASLPPE